MALCFRSVHIKFSLPVYFLVRIYIDILLHINNSIDTNSMDLVQIDSLFPTFSNDQHKENVSVRSVMSNKNC